MPDSDPAMKTDFEVPPAGGSDLPDAWRNLQDRLTESFIIRNELTACQSVSEITARAVQIVRAKLGSQTASIFLFDKLGRLYRVATAGVDSTGREIESGWFSDEVCVPGESFTWEAVRPSRASRFGSPQLTNDLEAYCLSPRVRDYYESKLGQLQCAAAIPLNGTNRTFGVLEIINREPRGATTRPEFSLSDVFWLSLIGTSVASTISMLGRRREAKILAMLGDWLSRLMDSDFDREAAYSELASSLVDRLQPYRACIIRLESGGTLRVVAKAGDEVSWEEWSNTHSNPKCSIIRQVYESGQAVFYSNVEPVRSRLTNIRWMDANQLVAYACLPLKNGRRSVGTLTLYVSYEYDFSPSVQAYLQNVSSLILAFAECCRIVDENAAITERTASFGHNISAAARITAMNAATEEITRGRHDLKNRLLEIKTALSETQHAGIKRKQSIESLIRKIDHQISTLETRLNEGGANDSIVAVDVNEVIEEAVQHLDRRRGKGRTIQIVPRLSSDVKPIMAVREEIQDLATNLIHNSIRAIEESRERNGLIEVSTRMVRDRHGIAFVEIAVSDNGCGIPVENKKKVYEQGFSTYERGTGVGLFTTRNTVRRYGGTIEFDSSIGRGTTFRVRLPWATLAAERRMHHEW